MSGAGWAVLRDTGLAVMEPEQPRITAGSPIDALMISMREREYVDPVFMGAMTGRDPESLMIELRNMGAVCQDPDQWQEDPLQGWVLTSSYCSGALYDKYERAKEARSRWPSRFHGNVELLKAAMPRKALRAKDIYVSLGARWIPDTLYNEFRNALLQREYALDPPKERVRFEDGRWKAHSARLDKRPQAQYHWGTPRYPFTRILEARMNRLTIEVNDNGPNGKPVRNPKETAAARECGAAVDEEFRRWLFEYDKQRSRYVRALYHWTFCSIVNEQYDGSYLTFPGLAPGLELYPYQKNAVARIIRSRSTLLAHGLGSGKTVTMVAAIMELNRLKLLNGVTLYVSPAHLAAQAKGEFCRFYPNARVLLVDGKLFSPARRQKVMQSIRDDGWDCVVVTYEVFKRIAFSSTWLYEETERELREVNSAQKPDKRRQKALQKKLLDLAAKEKTERGQIFFEDLGVRAIFVDEAHHYKNLPMLGAGKEGSEMARDMLRKVRFVQEASGWITMATATPTPNSVSDLLALQTYLQPELLRAMKLDQFQSWSTQFGEVKGSWDLDVDCRKLKYTERFVRFHNLPELARLLGECADFHETGKEADGVIPPIEYHTEVIPPPPDVEKYLDEIAERADRIHAGLVTPEEDNYFKLISLVQMLSTDVRLRDPTADPGRCKAVCCAQKAALIYWENQKRKGCQLIFCDLGTPKKDKFNVYDEIARLLTQLYGVPEQDIAFVQSETTAAGRNALFEKVRRGEVRILIGSTQTLGSGVNVQDRLVALHELDAPWRPADVAQREGRIRRPGHLWPNEVKHIYRYVVQDLDGYKWQTLKRKQRFQSQPLNSSTVPRTVEELEGGGDDFGQIMALAVRDGRMKELIELENRLRHLQILEAKEREMCRELEEKIYRFPTMLAEHDRLIFHLTQDSGRYRNNRRPLESERREKVGRAILDWTGEQPARYQGFDLEEGNGDLRYLRGAGRYPFHIYPDDEGVDCVARMDRVLGSLKKRLADAQAQRIQMEQDLEGWKEELRRLEDSGTRNRIDELEPQVDSLRRELERRIDN